MEYLGPILKGSHFKRCSLVLVLAILLNACASPTAGPAQEAAAGNETATAPAATETLAPPPSVPTAQPTAAPVSYGPDPSDFPPDINPLTGQPVSDPALLKVPAVLISISHFPATARPQAGLSFAPFVYEFSITDGETRFLAVFYGRYPAPEIPILGNCSVRKGLFEQTGTLLGNRVWLDVNKNGIQDQDEGGLPGVCVSLYDSEGHLLQQTTTDSNGYFGFNVKSGASYALEFHKPEFLDFTKPNQGDENHDSDADPSTGRSPLVLVTHDDLIQDAGMFPNDHYVPPAADAKTDPKAQVGPVRSGRLLYAHIGNYFQDSCLIYAFASSEVLPLLPHCAFVTHEDVGGGSMLDLARMKAVAEDNQRHTASRPFNYTSNFFADAVPAGGGLGLQINEFWASLNQSAWSYDPLYQAYLRYVDTADKNARGVLHAEVDRLTGRQLFFDNVIVLEADTDVVSPTNLDIRLDEGNSGNAYLFRDGRVFAIKWSTKAGTYEQQTGFRRPIRFLNNDGTQAALKPGRTWVIIVTPFSLVQQQQPGVYLVRYAAPEGESR